MITDDKIAFLPMKINHFGTLYIVATPLGNLQDMSFRAIEILKNVDCIAAEDTRHSSSLLQYFSIKTKMISLHEHNERERVTYLLERLSQGESIALISDAGTPLISDPGYVLVREAKTMGVRVVPIPGACAAITALSVAGLPTDRFIFEGFLPSKTKPRRERLASLRDEPRTLIFYEAPHRVLDLLQDMQLIFGNDRVGVIARELTKVFETIHSSTLAELVEWVEKDENQQRGEIVILIEGSKSVPILDKNSSSDRILSALLETLPLKQAVEIAAKITDQRKNELYQRALQLKSAD